MLGVYRRHGLLERDPRSREAEEILGRELSLGGWPDRHELRPAVDDEALSPTSKDVHLVDDHDPRAEAEVSDDVLAVCVHMPGSSEARTGRSRHVVTERHFGIKRIVLIENGPSPEASQILDEGRHTDVWVVAVCGRRDLVKLDVTTAVAVVCGGRYGGCGAQ